MNSNTKLNGYVSLSEAEKIFGIKANTLKRQCQNGKYPGAYKEGKTWFVPAPRIARGGSIQDFMTIIYGHEAIYGFDGGGVERLAKEIAEYNQQSILQTLAKISLDLFSKGFTNAETQTRLILVLFSNDVELRRKILNTIVQGENPYWVLFNEQSILVLLKVVLEYAKKGLKGKLISPDQLNKVGNWLLISTDVWIKSELDSEILTNKDYQREKIREYLTRQHFMMSRERLPYKIVRFYEIYKQLSVDKKNIDIETVFEKATGGISFQDYIFVCFLLIVKWVNVSSEVDLSKDWVVCIDKYFSKMKPEIKKIRQTLNFLLTDVKKYKQRYEDDVINVLKGKDSFAFNFLQFQKKPLIPFTPDCFICISPNFLMEKISEGTYWSLANYLEKKGFKKQLEALPALWGKAFELYIHEILKRSFGENYVGNLIIMKKEKMDGIIIGKDALFLIEDKYTHWPYRAKLFGNKEYMEKSLTQLFSKNKGLGQITKAIRENKAGKWNFPFSVGVRKIIPILIVGESMPQDAYNRKLYEDFAKINGSFYEDHRVMPFIILDIEEIEILEAISTVYGKNTAEFLLVEYSQIFINRNLLGYVQSAMSFKNYLHLVNFPVPNNDIIMDKFFKLADMVTKRAFPGSKGITESVRKV